MPNRQQPEESINEKASIEKIDRKVIAKLKKVNGVKNTRVYIPICVGYGEQLSLSELKTLVSYASSKNYPFEIALFSKNEEEEKLCRNQYQPLIDSMDPTCMTTLAEYQKNENYKHAENQLDEFLARSCEEAKMLQEKMQKDAEEFLGRIEKKAVKPKTQMELHNWMESSNAHIRKELIVVLSLIRRAHIDQEKILLLYPRKLFTCMAYIMSPFIVNAMGYATLVTHIQYELKYLDYTKQNKGTQTIEEDNSIQKMIEEENSTQKIVAKDGLRIITATRKDKFTLLSMLLGMSEDKLSALYCLLEPSREVQQAQSISSKKVRLRHWSGDRRDYQRSNSLFYQPGSRLVRRVTSDHGNDGQSLLERHRFTAK